MIIPYKTPVDLSKNFKESGMTLITDPSSDRYLREYTKLETSLKKEKKRKLKPQAMRARKEALRHFKKCHPTSQKRGVLSYSDYIPNQNL